jgi:hypothetical protein
MSGRFQYSLRSLLLLTLFLALAISSVLMYRRARKAEHENVILRFATGYDNKTEPVLVDSNAPVEIDIERNITSILPSGDFILRDYDSRVTFRNTSPKDVKVHFPLLRMSECFPRSCEFISAAKLDPEFKATKTISLKPGETFSFTLAKQTGSLSDRGFLEEKESFDFGRWALVFGVPDGENPDEYLTGTILTNPIHWKVDKDCKRLK